MEKISKFFHRLLRFDSPALHLTKTSWVKANDRRKIYFRINVRFWLGLASSLLDGGKREPKRSVLGILSMGLCARVVTCAFDLKSTSCKTGENDRSMISSSLGWLCRQSGGESREKNFSKKLKNFLSIFHPLWRISHLLYIERGTRHLWDGKKF
jgi:hypothetical protein